MFNGEVDGVTRRRKSLFSNTLVLPGFDALEAAKIDDPKKLDWAKHTLSLRRRHLEGAVFDGADLRKSVLKGAHLQGASLDRTQLRGASLDNADLQGASLFLAQLRSASLDGAQLQGASLELAHLQGASLIGAQLQSALLKDAQLQGAQLAGAQLLAASLNEVHLQGASLVNADLTGASLFLAQLQGAWLQNAFLEGADLQRSILVGTDMRDVTVWRTNFEDASLTAVLVDGVKEGVISTVGFAVLQTNVPEGEKREAALKTIEILNPGIFGPEASLRETLEKGRADLDTYYSTLADQLKSLACSGDEDAPYIVRGFIANGRVKETGAQAPGLVEAILDPKCPVSAALTEADKAVLEKLKKEASSAH